MLMIFSSSSLLLISSIAILPILSIEDAEFWRKLGAESIEASLNVKKNEGMAKNGIIFIGDGMGMATITAGRIFKGQSEGRTGEEGYLTNNSLQTYNVDRQVPDSAATATALFSGVKANYYTMGLDGTAQFNVCRTDVEAKAKVSSIIDWAIAAGKSTGKLRSEITACHHLLSAPSTFSPCPHDDFHSVYFTPDFLSLTLQHGCERTNAIFCHVMSYIHGRMEEEMDKLSALILCPII
ncbi:Intestinal-type alkaline phosphatase [Folsomia candida]|uniref:Alkaline phosphatase n=1 Tax=Folsomia candida TaxID=158441 RepID=A0A226DLF6_FOLCA|nr:Intestinal-type alkaline phosphatase [Folsomia candida]